MNKIINLNQLEIPFKYKLIGYVVAGGLILTTLNPFVVVQAGTRGVVTNFGKVSDEALGEGLHFVIPIMQKVHVLDVRIQKGEGTGNAASKDMQTVQTKVALNYHVNPLKVSQVFQNTGHEVGSRIVQPAVQESVKAITAQYTADELISKREEVKIKITNNLSERLDKFGILVDEFSITDFDFSKTFNEAIENKTTAEQLKLKAQTDLERIKIEGEQKITSAKAEAESLRLQKAEVTSEMLKLREIENHKLAIEKWDGKMPHMTGGALPFINIK